MLVRLKYTFRLNTKFTFIVEFKLRIENKRKNKIEKEKNKKMRNWDRNGPKLTWPMSPLPPARPN
jgi:hypothetical protein